VLMSLVAIVAAGCDIALPGVVSQDQN